MKKIIFIVVLCFITTIGFCQNPMFLNVGYNNQNQFNIGVVASTSEYSFGVMVMNNFSCFNSSLEKGGMYTLFGFNSVDNIKMILLAGMYHYSKMEINSKESDSRYQVSTSKRSVRFDGGYYLYYMSDKYSFGIKQTYYSDIAIIFGIKIN